jgi:hypothetical protein
MGLVRADAVGAVVTVVVPPGQLAASGCRRVAQAIARAATDPKVDVIVLTRRPGLAVGTSAAGLRSVLDASAKPVLAPCLFRDMGEPRWRFADLRTPTTGAAHGMQENAIDNLNTIGV